MTSGEHMTSLLNVDRAIELILMDLKSKGPEHIGITEALGRVAAADIVAPISLPPFANSALDGFAVVASDTSDASEDAPIELPIVMDIPAGKAPETALQPGQVARIMTGAPMPEGANAVIPVEDTNFDWEADDHVPLGDMLRITRPVKAGAGVRDVGESAKRGDVIIKFARRCQRPSGLRSTCQVGVRLQRLQIGVEAVVLIDRERTIRELALDEI